MVLYFTLSHTDDHYLYSMLTDVGHMYCLHPATKTVKDVQSMLNV